MDGIGERSMPGVILRHTLVGHTDYVQDVALDSTGDVLASGSKDNTIKLWDTTTGLLLNTIEEHHTIMTVTFDPKGQILDSGSTDKTVKLWEVTTGNLLHILEGHQDQI
jgi:WD40 repeat protein